MAPARPLVITAIVLVTGSVSGLATSPAGSEAAAIAARVGDRVASYYERAHSLICIETATVQPISRNWGFDGLARTVESELRVEAELVSREIRRINGREPRERDKTSRAGCTDPSPLSPEPLAFLMPSHRDEYQFTSVRRGRDGSRAALIIDFASTNRRSRAELVEDERGHDDCFDWTGPIAGSGRMWVDPDSYDVLRVDRHIDGIVDLRVSWALQRKHNIAPYFVLERDDVSTRYTNVAFRDPEESLLLPESVESLTEVRSGLQSTRRTSTFTGYRRFMTDGRVKIR